MLSPWISKVNSDEGEKPAMIWDFFLHDHSESLNSVSMSHVSATFPICPLHSQKLRPVLASCTLEYWRRSANLTFITYLWMTQNYFLANLEHQFLRPAQILGSRGNSVTSIPHRPPTEGFPLWICLSVQVKKLLLQSTCFLARTQSSLFSAEILRSYSFPWGSPKLLCL